MCQHLWKSTLVGEEKPAAGINASSSGKCQQIDFSGIAAWLRFMTFSWQITSGCVFFFTNLITSTSLPHLENITHLQVSICLAPSLSAELSPSAQRGHVTSTGYYSVTQSLTRLQWSSGVWDKVNSLRPDDAYLRLWTGLSWVAYGLSRTNPSSEPVMNYCKMGHREQTSVKFRPIKQNCVFGKTHV